MLRPALATLRDLVALTKPRLTALNVLMTWGGLFLAGGLPFWRAAAVLGGSALTVGAANALNMAWEHDADRRMARTRQRPLPAGRLSLTAAVVFGTAVGAAGVAMLAFVDPLAGALGAVGLLSYVLVYTPLKQVTPWALVVGALPGAIPPLLGTAAVTGTIDAVGAALFAVVLIWQLPHFLAIALYLKNDYAKAGIRVVPLVAGDEAAWRQAWASSLVLTAVSFSLLPTGAAGVVYAVTAAAVGAWLCLAAWDGMTNGGGVARARKLFFVSLVYLPAVTLGIAADGVIARLIA